MIYTPNYDSTFVISQIFRNTFVYMNVKWFVKKFGIHV